VLLALVLGLVLPASAMAFGQLSSFGEFGGGLGQLSAPKQIVVAPDGDLYVADSGNNRISVFAGDGSFLRTFGGGGLLSQPGDVALDGGGRAFVADSGHDRVAVFGGSGEFLFPFGSPALNDPAGLVVDGSTVYVADRGNERIAVYDTEGNPLPPIKPVFSFSPRDVIVGADGNLYVADFANKRVDVFSSAGAFLGSFGAAGPGALSGPVALAREGASGVYVADQESKRIEHFSEAGGFLDGFAAEPGVAGVAAACGRNVFAVEESASLARVVRFGEPGTPQPPCTPTEREPELIVDPAVKLPSNKFHFAGLRKNRANGFALLFVRVPGPGKVSLTGRGFRRLSRTARQATTVTLPVKPKVRLRHFLKQHGKGRIRVEVTFTPTGGEPRTREKVIVLRRHRS
jgi:DNA-binding beta-propeller fold protein YncE